ncbi:MAG: hypothetical protein V1495_03555 [Pseudomonadota bacterium]
MGGKRSAVEFLFCCFLSAALMHSIPAAHRVRQLYKLSRSSGAGDLPQYVTSAIRTELQKEDLPINVPDPVHCSETPTALQVECSATVHRRTDALALSRILSSTIPGRIGWIDIAVLKNRLRETRAKLTAWNDEFAGYDREIKELELQTVPAQRRIDKLRGERAIVESDLENRKRQLEILEEAIPNRVADETKVRFEKKRQEVVGIMRTLSARLDGIDREIVTASVPLDRKMKLEEILPELRGRIDLARTQVTSWNTLLAAEKNASIIADPDGIQLAALPTARPIRPLRTPDHLPWSVPLGALLFAGFRRKKFSSWRLRYFQSPEEVVRETGLPYLGSI